MSRRHYLLFRAKKSALTEHVSCRCRSPKLVLLDKTGDNYLPVTIFSWLWTGGWVKLVFLVLNPPHTVKGENTRGSSLTWLNKPITKCLHDELFTEEGHLGCRLRSSDTCTLWNSRFQILVQSPPKRFLNIFSIGSYWLAGRVIGYNSQRGPPKDNSNKVWSKLAKQFQWKRFLNIFPIGSYVKLWWLMSVVLAGRQSHWI